MPEGQTNFSLLKDAIARNCALVLSLPTAGMVKHEKSRFLGESGDGFWVEIDPAKKPILEVLVNDSQLIGVSFRATDQRVVFVASAMGVDLTYQVNSLTAVPALQLSFPKEIKAIQRRSNYRVHVRLEDAISIRIWRMLPRAALGDRPMASQEVLAEIRDLSHGGIGVVLSGKDKSPPKITTEDRLRIEIKHGESSLLLEGKMRNPSGPQPENKLCTGLRFKEMAGDLEGRQNLSQLNRIIGELQREEVRRSRKRIA